MVLKIERLKQRPAVGLCRNTARAEQEPSPAGSVCSHREESLRVSVVVMGSPDPATARNEPQLQQVTALLGRLFALP